MSKALEAALEAVRQMSSSTEIDAALWEQTIEELRQNTRQRPWPTGTGKPN